MNSTSKRFLSPILIIVSIVALSASSANDLPSNKSSLNGWLGMKLVEGKRCKQCCSIVFPKNYGLGSDQQIDVLIGLVNASSAGKIKHDVNCLLPIAYDVLDQLKYLVLTKHDSVAARLILLPNKERSLNLDGGAAYYYGNLYLKVVHDYPFIGHVTNSADVQAIASNFCYQWGNPNTEYSYSIKETVKAVENNGNEKLAKLIEQECKKYQ
jgi:hypothetical protein